MKKLFLLFFLTLLSINSVYGYTEKEGSIIRGTDNRVLDSDGDDVFLDSTTFFPTGFLDELS